MFNNLECLVATPTETSKGSSGAFRDAEGRGAEVYGFGNVPCPGELIN
jgi:hypothetical protein